MPLQTLHAHRHFAWPSDLPRYIWGNAKQRHLWWGLGEDPDHCSSSVHCQEGRRWEWWGLKLRAMFWQVNLPDLQCHPSILLINFCCFLRFGWSPFLCSFKPSVFFSDYRLGCRKGMEGCFLWWGEAKDGNGTAFLSEVCSVPSSVSFKRVKPVKTAESLGVFKTALKTFLFSKRFS